MKQFILSAALLVSVSFSSINAMPVPGDEDKTERNFKKSFPTAECIKWSREGDYRKVTFILYGRGAQALFSPDGNLLGTVRNVFYSDMPIKVMMAIKKRFDSATPYAITEVNRVDGTEYRFSIEVKNNRFEATITPDGNFNRVTSK